MAGPVVCEAWMKGFVMYNRQKTAAMAVLMKSSQG